MRADQLCVRTCVVATHRAGLAMPARDERHTGNPLARTEPLTALDHLAGEVGAEYVRERQPRKRVAAGASADVEQPSHPHRTHPDEHLAGSGLRRRRVLDPQDLRRSKLVDHRGLHDTSAITGLVSRPKSATSISTTSPGRRNSPRGRPTPSGVPVAITSPGSSVRIALAAAMSAATSSIMSEVVACWLRFPFIHCYRCHRSVYAVW